MELQPPRDLNLAKALLTNSESTLQYTQIAIYINLCALTAVTWDWIISLAGEYRVVKRCGVRSAAVLAYVLARASALTLCVLVLLFYTGLPDSYSCSGAMHAIGAMVVLGNASKSYLFLLRLRAVYSNSKLATLCVGAGAFVLLGLRIAGMLRVHASPLGHTGYCQVNTVGSLSAVSSFFNMAFDTCIFVAIFVRLTSHTISTNNSGFISFIRGDGLPRTMRHLLQDGMLYYFTVLAFMLLAAIIAVDPQVSPILQAAFTIPTFVMENNMACNMFRAMIIRSLDVDQDTSLPPTSRTRDTTDFELDTRTMAIGPEQIW
ncbi:hypothetical protein FIBSPDRAFT_1054098 [Athelia psychrophila]|uniref:G-protein coupled receptors family 1 profile domain-containing protein n=1 Tax=Athelia psychrophila TaxID=1759441 RepID=A0A167VV01_9AGAM|nr:hypothetical protein FIBSPDRAFT_1054098 [Fibularhizoctonia sp. CBS 109695]